MSGNILFLGNKIFEIFGQEIWAKKLTHAHYVFPPWRRSLVVSFPPSFARTFSSKERRLGTRQLQPELVSQMVKTRSQRTLIGRNKNAFYWLIGERTKLQGRTQLQRYRRSLKDPKRTMKKAWKKAILNTRWRVEQACQPHFRQPRPQGFSLKNVFQGKALGTRLHFRPILHKNKTTTKETPLASSRRGSPRGY